MLYDILEYIHTSLHEDVYIPSLHQVFNRGSHWLEEELLNASCMHRLYRQGMKARRKLVFLHHHAGTTVLFIDTQSHLLKS